MAPYFIRNLVPHKLKVQSTRPFSEVLASITFVQWALFWSGWLSWTCDAVDFFAVSLSVRTLEKVFDRPASEITQSITLTLLFRPVGALFFGIVSDRYGRKWPLVANLLLITGLQIGAGFAQNFKAFLALRSLFGIGMGGIWGMAASTSLENLPVEARGIASGILQQGYACGYLIASLINLFLVPSAGWRSLFFTAAGMSFFGAFVRAVLPESEVFVRVRALEKERGGTSSGQKTKIFIRETGEMLQRHWRLCIYAVLLMSGFNFLSHGSQDLYPTYLEVTKAFNSHNATIATIIGSCGAISGGVFAGWLSQYIGRRLTIILHVLLVGAFIPLWILPTTFSSLAAGAFCVQFGVQGAWGVIPIQLAELSPPAFRATFPGVSYQLGNMISSASAQIEAVAGEHWKTTVVKDGKRTVVPDYAKVQGLVIGLVAAFVIFITIVGPENHGSHFEHHKAAFEEGAANDDAVIEDRDPPKDEEMHVELRSKSMMSIEKL